jgi:glycosyltransferase involved in cell wall biosynthesis
MQERSDHPFFSIIIPTYNRAHLITKAIKSVLEQSFQDFELIIVDDASTDNTEEIVAQIKDSRIRYFKQKENQERSAARNYGVSVARAKFVNFFDSDDVLYPNHLQEAFTNLNENIPVYYQRAEVILDNKKIAKKDIIQHPVIHQFLKQGNILSTNGVFLKREIAKENPFREDMNLSEDYELWLRLALQYDFHYSPKITSAILEHHQRGINNIRLQLIIRNKQKFLDYIFNNQKFQDKYKKYKNVLLSGTYLYISLYAVLAKDNRCGYRYLFLALWNNPFCLLDKRPYAIIKHLLLKSFK